MVRIRPAKASPEKMVLITPKLSPKTPLRAREKSRMGQLIQRIKAP